MSWKGCPACKTQFRNPDAPRIGFSRPNNPSFFWPSAETRPLVSGTRYRNIFQPEELPQRFQIVARLVPEAENFGPVALQQRNKLLSGKGMLN
jgi:hypothetical protein